ncbi:conserved oligomeric Golgi complex subunit 1-like [Uloborus diversus]|uniref:conserved oligomeric Golgi complex subunit 1-like n=1 Tax=Uloborus diversus TaxID=327109 RepID=UPI0024091772|nr:conserved oligomeric Golgi complex subunit 1-like [Uloborus diversus]
MTVGTDILFENHTIKEIQEIEKKLRNDIERKKEELRQMVGERYRDLMDAADTITEMKEIAESVTTCVRSVEIRSTDLQNGSLRRGILNTIQNKVDEKRRQNELLYTVASQIKILMDSPTKIWSYIEAHDFISAVSLYLLARHTHSLLVLDPVYQDHKIASLFPIINRQWTSISHLKYVLIQNCCRVLEAENIEPENAIGPLCCNCLLSNSSLEDIVLEILAVRKNVIKSVFHPEKYAKDQVCEFVTAVQKTLSTIYILFYCSDKVDTDQDYQINMLYSTLKKITSSSESGPVNLLDLKSSEVFNFLPSSITDYRSSLKEPFHPCNSEFLQIKCNQWLKDIKENFQKDLINLLNFVGSVKSVAMIRQSVINLSCEIQMKFWDKMCRNMLKKTFSLWDFFLKDCFFQRVKDIINEKIKTANETCQRSIEETMCKICSEAEESEFAFERNVSYFIWFEMPNDTLENIAWIPRHQRNFWDSGELSMKSMGFTPKVQSICRDLDQQLQNAVEDVSTFSVYQNEMDYASEQMSEISHSQNPYSMHIMTGSSDTFKYLTEAVENQLFNLTSYIETTLLYVGQDKNISENSYRIIFMGYLSQAITNLCPHVNVCLSADKLSETFQNQNVQKLKHSISSLIVKENESWKELKSKFLQISCSAFRLWSSDPINQVLNAVDEELIPCSADGLLKALLRWDRIEIQEESEQGKAVSSVLRIPQHISVPLSNALFSFCCKLNTIGGHSINSEVRSHISKQLLCGLLEIYKRKIHHQPVDENFNPRLLQVQSLQMLFDVQFLMGLIVHKDGTNEPNNQISQEIINEAVSHVDPFDMDVFSVPLQQNLKKSLQKSLALFGLIASPDQISYLNSIKAPSVNSQMEHNVMLSSNTGSRFPLLPLSSRTNAIFSVADDSVQPAAKETEAKMLPSHSSSPNLSATDTPINTLKSTSFYEKVTAMSSSWFGN